MRAYTSQTAAFTTPKQKIRAISGRTESQPYFLGGQNVSSISENGYLIRDGTFTTSDSSKPDFRLHARKIRVYEHDRVIFQYVTAYIGKVPIFWWPYLYQSLDNAFSFTVSPAYYSTWGPSLLTQVTFPIRDNIQGRVRLNYYCRRGPAIGFEPTIEYGKDKSSSAKKNFLYSGPKPEPESNICAAAGCLIQVRV